MKSLTQTMIVLCVISLATGGFAVAQDSSGGKPATYTISGSVGVPGVVMRGLPGNVISDKQGNYLATVERTWKGTVTPIKEGYRFTPVSRAYMTPLPDMTNQDYVPAVVTYTISGSVGIPGVVMRGFPSAPVVDQKGRYIVKVESGWQGAVTPEKEGYTFTPAKRIYTNVTNNLTDKDYAPNAVLGYEDMMYYEGTPGFSSRRHGRSTGYSAVGPVGSRKVLIVPAEEIKPEELATITEDLQVMSYILDERFRETRRIQGVFTDFGDFFGRDNRATEATWLQGYGVLFSMEVNFAFSPPPKPQPMEAESADEQADSTWQRAKQQVFSPGEFAGAGGGGSPEEYNSQMVEELQRDLITTLKHAANVRGLQPDEWIILTLVGGGREAGIAFGNRPHTPGMGGVSSMSSGSSYGTASSGGTGGYSSGYSTSGGFVGGGVSIGSRGGMGMGGGMMGGMAMGASSSTVLTIRAHKSDVDAFAKGEMTFDQFREKMKILMY